MEESNDVIPVNKEKILASLGYVVISNFVATNNEVFKICKYMADFYLRYKKIVIEIKCNQIALLNEFFSKNQKVSSVFISKNFCT